VGKKRLALRGKNKTLSWRGKGLASLFKESELQEGTGPFGEDGWTDSLPYIGMRSLNNLDEKKSTQNKWGKVYGRTVSPGTTGWLLFLEISVGLEEAKQPTSRTPKKVGCNWGK